VIRHSKPNIKKKDLVSVLENLVSDNIADGATVKEFEKQFASQFSMRSNHAVSLGSGTDAIYLGLKALEVGPGDEVIMPSFVCSAPYHAVVNNGAVPVLCDIGADFNISVSSAKSRITEKTKAIIVPHMFGQPADLDPFLELDIPIIEDCAQALGAVYKNRPVGSFGKFSVFSFYATKVITTGYGGILFSRDARLAAAVKTMRFYDKKEELTLSCNSNISDFQAAMGINQLKRLDHFIKLRRSIAEVYNRKLIQTHHEIPQIFEDRQNIYFRYPVRLRRSLKSAIEFLKKNKIEGAQPVFKPLHHYMNLPVSDFPETERAFLKTLSIPIYPALLNKEVDFIAKVVSRIV